MVKLWLQKDLLLNLETAVESAAASRLNVVVFMQKIQVGQSSAKITPFLQRSCNRVLDGIRLGNPANIPNDWNLGLKWKLAESPRLSRFCVPYLLKHGADSLRSTIRSSYLLEPDERPPFSHNALLLKNAASMFCELYNLGAAHGIKVNQDIFVPSIFYGITLSNTSYLESCCRATSQIVFSRAFLGFINRAREDATHTLCKLRVNRLGTDEVHSITAQHILNAVTDAFGTNQLILEACTDKDQKQIGIKDNRTISVPHGFNDLSEKCPIEFLALLIMTAFEVTLHRFMRDRIVDANSEHVDPLHVTSLESKPHLIFSTDITRLIVCSSAHSTRALPFRYLAGDRAPLRELIDSFGICVVKECTGIELTASQIQNISILPSNSRSILDKSFDLLSEDENILESDDSSILIPKKEDIERFLRTGKLPSSARNAESTPQKRRSCRIQDPSLGELVHATTSRVDLETFPKHARILQTALNSKLLGVVPLRSAKRALVSALAEQDISNSSRSSLESILRTIEARLSSGSNSTLTSSTIGSRTLNRHQRTESLSEVAIDLKSATEIIDEYGIDPTTVSIASQLLLRATALAKQSFPGKIHVRNCRKAVAALYLRVQEQDYSQNRQDVLDLFDDLPKKLFSAKLRHPLG